MKLNPDCIRDILLKIEETTDAESVFTASTDVSNLINAYGENALLYHIKQCDYHGFFINCKFYASGNYVIQDLSPEGHAFLSETRSSKVWDKTKEICIDVGVDSLKSLVSVATKVAASFLTSHFGM